MKINLFFCWVFLPFFVFGQTKPDSTVVYKKRVLENTEVDLLSSFYHQNGQNAAVTGGIGSEKLDDFATDISVSIPVKLDGVLSINGTVSAYTSASSSNLNPWTGASKGGGDDDDDDDDDDDGGGGGGGANTGTPWAASTGASRKDVWTNLVVGYSHSSDDRNTIISGNISAANEYDYMSVGAGMSLAKLYNKKNTRLSINANVYLDGWRPEYPTEIKTFYDNGGNLNADFFQGTDILDQTGAVMDKSAPIAWKPNNTNLITDKGRNSYALALGFSQILSKTTQIGIFSDLNIQTGWLANPMQRVYFADKANYYIGNATSIPFYTDPKNRDVFQLADDIERLPHLRIKVPIGIRLNQYINEYLVLRTYYRYYFDDWGLKAHTINGELAIKLGNKFTLYPNYRFYIQTAANYFAPYEQLLSTSEFYTSDYDLSAYRANQYGLGVKYTDKFTSKHLWIIALKSLSLDYNYYGRSTGLNAHIVTFGASFVLKKLNQDLTK